MKILRAVSAGWSELQNFVPKLWGIARQLFNEIMGIVFLALAAFFAFGAQGMFETFRGLDENPDAGSKLILLGAVVLMFVGFGISSFRRARKIQREG